MIDQSEHNSRWPMVSVLTTAFNREHYISEAIESVLASTYKNFELIIVDDCSSDRTAEIARKYEVQDSRVKVYENEKNLGDYPNRNKAASYASGEFLMYVDSDDTIYPDGIEKVVDLLKQFPEVNFASRIYEPLPGAVVLTSEAAIERHFFQKPFLTLGPGGTVIRRSYFESIGGFPEKYGPANDMYYNLKAACQTNTLLMPFEYLNYRIHDGQEINNKYSYLYNSYLYQKDALAELPLPLSPQQLHWLRLKNKRRFLVNLVKYALKTRQFNKVKVAIRKTRFTGRDVFDALFQANKVLKKSVVGQNSAAT